MNTTTQTNDMSGTNEAAANELADGIQDYVNSQDANDKKSDKINPGVIRKSTTASILRAAQNATGMEFSSVEDMMGALAKLSQLQALQSSQTNNSNNNNHQETAEETRKRVTTNDLAEKYEQLRAEMAQKEQKLREKELDNSIRNALGDRFDTDLMDYTISRIRESLYDQDGEWIVVNSKQQQRYTSEGRPMTVRDLVEDLAKNNPKLLKQSLLPAQGSGLRPQQGVFDMPGDNEFVPDYTKDPAAFNAWAQRNGLGKNVGLRGVNATVSNSTQVRKIM